VRFERFERFVADAIAIVEKIIEESVDKVKV
jgi:hypothetical protein